MSATIISKKNRKQAIYGFNSVTTGDEVTALVKKIRQDLGPSEMNKVLIYVMTGTHGNTTGDLVGEDFFYQEDKLGELQTVKAVRINQNTPVNTWNTYFSKTNAILILAWCYSDRWSGLSTYNK